mmetsp:Transcript_16572/g.41893  ORF Transcript_16572/g.41893 Transcript_16572/m.41893 type:complete len:223 (-) Transcript_16572:70-738(-)
MPMKRSLSIQLPGDESHAPGDENHAPGDENLAPGDESLAPGDENPAPGDESVAKRLRSSKRAPPAGEPVTPPLSPSYSPVMGSCRYPSKTFYPLPPMSPPSPTSPRSPTSPPNSPISPPSWTCPFVFGQKVMTEGGKVGHYAGELKSGRVSVTFPKGDMETFGWEALEAQRAQKGDLVVILHGEMKGVVGKCLGLDGTDAILRIKGRDNCVIADRPSLGVLC